MAKPLISVVIPTAGRPHLLRLAVHSALDDLGSKVEVVIVPNGPEATRQGLLPAALARDPRIQIEPISTPGANPARNRGLEAATGKYLRFLDDDDLLLPGASENQCALLEKHQADVCSGAIDLVDESGLCFREWPQPRTSDLVEATLLPTRVTANNAHVFLRSAIDGLRWDPAVALGQDTHWMHQLCRAREWDWVRTDRKVGVWRHHSGSRISASARTARHWKVSADLLLGTAGALATAGRLTPSRRAAAAAGLWSFIHRGFFMDPLHWTRIMRATQNLLPGSHPDIPLYRSPLGRVVPPLLLETIATPKRWVYYRLHALRHKRGTLRSVLPP